jgi:hypothetical protein
MSDCRTTGRHVYGRVKRSITFFLYCQRYGSRVLEYDAHLLEPGSVSFLQWGRVVSTTSEVIELAEWIFSSSWTQNHRDDFLLCALFSLQCCIRLVTCGLRRYGRTHTLTWLSSPWY